MDYILTSENFDSSVNALNRPYIIKFGSETCGPCKTMKPVLEKFRESYPETMLFEVDTDQSPELASHFQIRSVPTIHICEGREILYSFYGVTPFRDLEFAITNIDQPHFREHGQFKVDRPKKSYTFEALVIVLLVIFISAFTFLSL